MTTESKIELEALLQREWLLALGNGGYASGTLAGPRTRSYHGLLIGAFAPPVGRRLLVSHVDEAFTTDGVTTELATHCYPEGVVHPEGHRSLIGVTVGRVVTWRHEIDGNVVDRSVVPIPGRNAVAVLYDLISGEGGTLDARFFLSDRSHHGGAASVQGRFVLDAPGEATWRSDENPSRRLHIAASGVLVEDTVVNRDFVLAREQDRGFAGRENHASPGTCRLDLDSSASPAWLMFSTEPLDAETRRSVIGTRRPHPAPIDPVRRLRSAARAFVIRHPDSHRRGVIAGYPWFGEWGRDTMISLPGLATAFGGWEELVPVLLAWCDRLSLGMLPNRLADEEADDIYNSVDAAFWFTRAVDRYWRTRPDPMVMRSRLMPALIEIARSCVVGTRSGIQVDERDGLLAAGDITTQLTWMDARTAKGPVTPRDGKCVEVNALYYLLLDLLRELHTTFGFPNDARVFERTAARVRKGMSRFHDPARGYLADRITDEGLDFSLRPNQIFAFSESRTAFDPEIGRAAMAVVERELLTPFGLRTLSPAHADYVGRYEGAPEDRDAAYHQGTVWPWPIGGYVDAMLAVHGATDDIKVRMSDVLRPLIESMDDAGVGQIAEVYDGDEPHRAAGTIAQAWSVAEVMRVWHTISQI